jgi:hypothetical protein
LKPPPFLPAARLGFACGAPKAEESPRDKSRRRSRRRCWSQTKSGGFSIYLCWAIASLFVCLRVKDFPILGFSVLPGAVCEAYAAGKQPGVRSLFQGRSRIAEAQPKVRNRGIDIWRFAPRSSVRNAKNARPKTPEGLCVEAKTGIPCEAQVPCLRRCLRSEAQGPELRSTSRIILILELLFSIRK